MSEKKVLIMQLCVCEVFFELKQLVDQLATILIIILVVF